MIYMKHSRHATYNFNQDAKSLYRNHPRLPFEFYININLSNIGTAKKYISTYFNSTDLQQVMPLVKSIDMPSMKIETTPLNQYNRRRLSQSKISFDPVKVVFHDVADGKTLKFWEMYYRYYFADGSEAGMNKAKEPPPIAPPSFQDANAGQSSSAFAATDPRRFDQAAMAGQSSSAFAAIDPRRLDAPPPPKPTATNTDGDKRAIHNIIADTLDNHNFGFNIPDIMNVRNLIQTIDIYQVHAGRFNQVTLVNPRISAFTHDSLNYATGEKTLEITMTFEYEYAYYTIQNMKLNGGQPNNTSTIEQFSHGKSLELPSMAFTATAAADFVESNNPLLDAGNMVSQQIGKNLQASLGSVMGSSSMSSLGSIPTLNGVMGGSMSSLTNGLQDTINTVSSSVLDGMINLSPIPSVPSYIPGINPQDFMSTASNAVSSIASSIPSRVMSAISADISPRIVESPMYQDFNRIKGLFS